MGSSPKTAPRGRGDYGVIGGGGAARSARGGQRRAGAWLLALAGALAVVGLLHLEAMHSLTSNAGAWVAAHGRGAPAAAAPLDRGAVLGGGAAAGEAAAAPAATAAQPQQAQQAQPQAAAAAAAVAAPQQQQQQQQQQAAAAAGPAIPPRALMLATHSRLMWYDPDTDTSHIIHEGEVGAGGVGGGGWGAGQGGGGPRSADVVRAQPRRLPRHPRGRGEW
jgi:hypothetical protein